MRFRGIVLQLSIAAISIAQTAPDQPEISSQDEATTFQSKVNLVQVPVVVRDSHGRAVGNLKKEDFELFDRGKPQVISRFSIENGTEPKLVPAGTSLIEPENNSVPTAPVASRFIAYVFDDVHIEFGDLSRVRTAAAAHLEASLKASDRAAIFTTSGQVTQDFTDDRNLLRQALNKLQPRPITGTSGHFNCPDESFYEADLIQSRGDPTALQVAIQDAMQCLHLDPSTPGAAKMAEATARSEASRMFNAGEHESHVSLTVLRQLISRMAIMPGQRTILLVSPGFFLPDDLRSDEAEVMDRAIHAGVLINSLDARGLYTIDTLGDISREPSGSPQMFQAAATANADVLAELAYGTGGGFFQNSNDYAAGFRKLATPPEFLYVLGFSPDKLKYDGSYHSLKVRVTAPGKFELQVRRGYYAPKHAVGVEETAKEEISDAVFSRDELRDLPVDLKTQFFKTGDLAASLSVLAHVNLRGIHFRKAEGRNLDNLTMVAALFDRNGNFVKATQETVYLKLFDRTLNKTPAITLKANFDIAPGSYVVRLVMRDSEHQLMAAASNAVEIPF